MNHHSTSDPQIEQIGDLIRQLADVEARLQELTDGEVDAVVDPTTGAPILLQRAQQSLRRDKAKLRLLVDHLPGVIWTTDGDMRVTSVTGSGLDTLDLDTEAWLGERVSSFSQTDDDIWPAVQGHQQALRGEPASFELELAGHTYDCSVEPLRDGTGQITGTVGLAVDITPRVEMEREIERSRDALERRVEERTAELSQAYEELQVSEEEIRQQNQELRSARNALEAERRRYQQLFEFAPDGYIVTDQNGVIQEANRAASEMLGVHGDFLTGKPLNIYVADQDRHTFHELTTRADDAGDGHRTEIELEIQPRGRGSFPASVSLASADRGSEDGAMRWLLRDISETRRLMNENQNQRRFLERLMDVAPVGIAVVSGADHRFEMVNAQYRAIPGAEGPFLGRTFSEVFPESPPGYGQAILDEVHRTGEPIRVSERRGAHVADTGQTYWSVDVVPLRGSGDEIERLLIVARDVTQAVQARKAVERLAVQIRRQADQLEAVFQSMTDAVIVYDESGTPVQANRAAIKAYGVDPAGADRGELAEILQIRGPEGGPVDAESLPSSRALAGQTVEGARYLFRNAQGREVMIVASAAPLKTGETITGSVVVWHDVTEREQLLAEVNDQRQRAQELAVELQRERDKLQTIMENTHAQLAYLDADFNFVHVNTAYAAGAGRSRDQLVGRNHFKLFPHAENETIFKQVVQTGEPVSFRGRPFVYRDDPDRGTTYWDWSLVPVEGDDGEVTGLVFSLLDVTEREELMQRLDAHQARLQAILDNTPEGIVVVDDQARITLTNRAADELYERRVPYGQPFVSHGDLCICYPDGTAYAPRNLPLTRAALDGESHEGVELTLLTPDGRERHLLVSTAPIRDGERNVTGAVGVFRDITERKRIEEAVRRYAQRLRILHELDQAILVTHSGEEIATTALNRLCAVIPCHRTSVELFDADAQESLVLAVQAEGETNLRPDRRTSLSWNRAYDEMESGDPFVVEDLTEIPPTPITEALRQEGILSYVSVPLRTRDELLGALNVGFRTKGAPKRGELEAIQEVAQELAIGIHHAHLHQELQAYANELEQRVAARTTQLRASEARFRAIFEQSALGIGLLDRRGHVMIGNQALMHMLGEEREDVVGRRLTDFAHPDEDIALDVAAYQEMGGGTRDHHRAETRYVGPGGEMRWANMVLSLVRDAEDEPQFIIAIVEDITERKRAHQALIQSEKLATTGRLAASLAHEINNPLQTVIGCLGLAEESMDEPESEDEVETYVVMAHEELKRAARIVSRLRDLSRPTEPGQGEPTDVNGVIDSVLKVSRKDLKNSYIRVVCELAEDLPHPVLVQDRIKQVLLNLVLNARDAMPEGGELTLRTEHDQAQDEVVITVADQGTGIPDDVIDRLFDPFFSTKEQGSGLGLFVSRNIVQEQGGRIEVESTVGQGATFRVHLPVSTS